MLPPKVEHFVNPRDAWCAWGIWWALLALYLVPRPKEKIGAWKRRGEGCGRTADFLGFGVGVLRIQGLEFGMVPRRLRRTMATVNMNLAPSLFGYSNKRVAQGPQLVAHPFPGTVATQNMSKIRKSRPSCNTEKNAL